MPSISVLPQHIADLIAAGEVVERPASVVKELTENAVDAGARSVSVEIRNGGLTFLRVTDDGCGMTREDAPKAFLRHATSKIRTAADLEAIGTLGFRGEALAATAAVSRIDLLTRAEGEDTGTALSLEGGKVLSLEDAGCPCGTTICVRDLFFNTPARLKYMKRDSTEASAVLGVLQHQALAHPEVAFSYLRDGQEELSTSGDGDLAAAIYQVYGREFSRSLCPVDGTFDGIRLSGFVTKPTATRGSRSFQSFFCNGRYIRSRLLGAALEEAYRNRIMVGRFPGCVLFLTLPEKNVDVNVHPAKTEVRFLAEQSAYDCVRYGVQAALQAITDRPELRLPKPPAPPQPSSSAPQPRQDFFRTMSSAEYRTLNSALHQDTGIRPAPAVTDSVLPPKPSLTSDILELRHTDPAEDQRLHGVPKQPPVPTPIPAPEAEPAEPDILPELKPPKTAPYTVIGEVLDTYLIVEQEKTVYFIDKHAAHERILFEKLKKQPRSIPAQTLLEPVAASLSPEEASAVLENRELLGSCGFALEEFGDSTVLLRAVPADLDAVQGEAALTALAAMLVDGSIPDPRSLRDELLHTVACKAAIKAGRRTSPQEREALIREVMTREDLKYCPHGRPICIRLTEQNLEKQFKRT